MRRRWKEQRGGIGCGMSASDKARGGHETPCTGRVPRRDPNLSHGGSEAFSFTTLAAMASSIAFSSGSTASSTSRGEAIANQGESGGCEVSKAGESCCKLSWHTGPARTTLARAHTGGFLFHENAGRLSRKFSAVKPVRGPPKLMLLRLLLVGCAVHLGLAKTVDVSDLTVTSRACQGLHRGHRFCDAQLELEDRIQDLIDKLWAINASLIPPLLTGESPDWCSPPALNTERQLGLLQ